MTIALRFALYVDLMLLFGMAGYALHAGGKTKAVGRGAMGWLALAGVALSVAAFAFMIADMMGGSLGDIDGETLKFVLQDSSVGTALIVRLAALLLLLLLVLVAPHWATAWVGVALAGIALGSLAWLGHAAASEGLPGTLHRAGDVVHLLAAGAWLGALVVFMSILVQARGSPAALEEARAALGRFSFPGTLIVALLVATGAFNLLMIVGWDGLLHLPATRYGQLLIAKLTLFLVMLGLAASNRWRLTPALERGLADGETDGAAKALRLSIQAEVTAFVAILLLVGWLGTLDPRAA